MTWLKLDSEGDKDLTRNTTENELTWLGLETDESLNRDAAIETDSSKSNRQWSVKTCKPEKAKIFYQIHYIYECDTRLNIIMHNLFQYCTQATNPAMLAAHVLIIGRQPFLFESKLEILHIAV